MDFISCWWGKGAAIVVGQTRMLVVWERDEEGRWRGEDVREIKREGAFFLHMRFWVLPSGLNTTQHSVTMLISSHRPWKTSLLWHHSSFLLSVACFFSISPSLFFLFFEELPALIFLGCFKVCKLTLKPLNGIVHPKNEKSVIHIQRQEWRARAFSE